MKETPLSNCERQFILKAIEKKEVSVQFSAFFLFSHTAFKSFRDWMEDTVMIIDESKLNLVSTGDAVLLN